MIKTSLILCGGKGTRLKKRLQDSPKILAKIKGIPFLHYQLKWLEEQEIKKVFLLTKYKSSQISKYINNNFKKYNLRIEVIKEKKFCGTGGAIKNFYTLKKINSHCLILNGDTYFNIKNISNYYKFHIKNNFLVSIGAAKISNADRYGGIKKKYGYFESIENTKKYEKNKLVFAGLMIARIKEFNKIKKNIFQIEDFFNLYKNFNNIGVYSFRKKNFFYDYGTIKSYDAISKKGFRKKW